ncbi:MAG: NAD-dependent epimerase/dehydratase family protein, partial [Sphingomonadales bacterium]
KASDDSDYGRSKRGGEEAMLKLAEKKAATVVIYRLPGVFGKWARPNYNSVVATFCHNIAHGLRIDIDDPDAPLDLLYIDDLIDQWMALIDAPPTASGLIEPTGVEHTSVGHVAELIAAFAEGRKVGRIEDVGTSLERALYATFIAALPEDAFSYPLVAHVDPRGCFSEILKTRSSGQVSFITAHPSVTRGGHYHHTKVEKFVVVHGEALFRFHHVLSGAWHEIRTSAKRPVVVESIPGWAHDVTNVGKDVMVALVWASEPFDASRPDTVALPL